MALWRICRLLLAMGMLPLMTACSDLWLTQPKGKALVKLGDRPRTPVLATGIAGYYAPYALLSLAAYVDANYVEDRERATLRPADDAAPKRRLLDDTALIAELEANFPEPGEQARIVRSARTQLAQWWVQQSYYRGPLEVSGARKPKPDFECIVGEGNPKDGADRLTYVRKRTAEECARLEPLDGLGIVVFYRHEAPCDELVIAFRGTDFAQADDWKSNFRAVTRLLPYYDQYEQVQDHIHGIVQDARRSLCPRGFGRITAVGHSLGGGLAQQAAYARPDITRVYAFDSSMVTGYYDDHIARSLKGNKEKLKIDRVFEHGEILAYLRLVARHIVPPSNCEPLTRSARFDEVKGYNPFEQHKMALLTGHLLKLAGDRIPRRRQAEPNLPAPPEADPRTGQCLPVTARR